MLRTNLQLTSMATLLIGICTISPGQAWATTQSKQNNNNVLVQKTLLADKPAPKTPKPFTPTDNGGPKKPTVGSGTR